MGKKIIKGTIELDGNLVVSNDISGVFAVDSEGAHFNDDSLLTRKDSEFDYTITTIEEFRNLANYSGRILIKDLEFPIQEELELTVSDTTTHLEFINCSHPDTNDNHDDPYLKLTLIGNNKCSIRGLDLPYPVSNPTSYHYGCTLSLKNFRGVQNCGQRYYLSKLVIQNSTYIDNCHAQEIRESDYISNVQLCGDGPSTQVLLLKCSHITNVVTASAGSVSVNNCHFLSNIIIEDDNLFAPGNGCSIHFTDCSYLENIKIDPNGIQCTVYQNCTHVDPFTCSGVVQSEDFGKPFAMSSDDTFEVLNIKNGSGEDSIQLMNSTATGNYAYAEGNGSTATGDYGAHAEGNATDALGEASHSEGSWTTARGSYSHAEGTATFAVGQAAHAEGINNNTQCNISNLGANATLDDVLKTCLPAVCPECGGTTFIRQHELRDRHYSCTNCNWGASSADLLIAYGEASHAEGFGNIAYEKYSHAEGKNTIASGEASHTEGRDTSAEGSWAHAEGYDTHAIGGASHTEGYSTTASHDYSHAEGSYNTTRAPSSHVEGTSNTIDAIADGAHAEGKGNTVSAIYSHAEGVKNQINIGGIHAHVEGIFNTVAHSGAHVGGVGNTSSAEYQTVIGTSSASNPDALFIVGNGKVDVINDNLYEVTSQSNAFTVNKDGTATVGADPVAVNDVATKNYIDSKVGELDSAFFNSLY